MHLRILAHGCNLGIVSGADYIYGLRHVCVGMDLSSPCETGTAMVAFSQGGQWLSERKVDA